MILAVVLTTMGNRLLRDDNNIRKKNVRLAVDLDGSGLEGEILGVDRDSLRGLMDGQAWQV